MFIISLTYIVPLATVDLHMEAHIKFLNEQYTLGNFHASGRKTPRTGGVIFSMIKDREEMLNIINKDPFIFHKVSSFELIEFTPSKTCNELSYLLEQQDN